MKNPTLIYDGDCNFCQYCVNYLKLKTGSKLDYVPYQTATFGQDKAACTKAIHLVVSETEVYKGAAAGFKVLTFGGNNTGWWLYQNLPGLTFISEKLYVWVTHHRNFSFKVAKILCGNPWKEWRLPFSLLAGITIICLALAWVF